MNETYPDWIYVTFFLAFPYFLALVISAGLGDHSRWCGDIVRRQLLGLAVVALGVLLPAFAYGISFNHIGIGLLVLALSSVPHIVVFRLFRRRYDQWVSDQLFLEEYTEKDNTPIVNHRPICD